MRCPISFFVPNSLEFFYLALISILMRLVNPFK